MKRLFLFLAVLFSGVAAGAATDWYDNGGGGGGGSSSLKTGAAVTGGAANQVLFEDAGQNLASTGTVTIATATGVITLSTANIVGLSSATFVNHYDSSGDACGQGHMAFTLASSTSTGITMDPVNGAIYFCSQDNITGILYNQNAGANPNFTVGSGNAGSASNLLLSLNATNNGFYGGNSGGAINIVPGGTEIARFNATGLKIGAAANPTQTLDVTGNASFTTGIVGVTNSSLAAAGAVGEDLSVSSTAFVNAASSGTWTNVASKSFASGDYNISGCVTGKLNGATATDFEVAISSFSGNTTTDHVEGQNWIEGAPPLAASTLRQSQCVPPYHIHLGSSVIMYLKALWAFTAGTPQAIGTMAATRQR